MPAHAGIHLRLCCKLKKLDSGLRRNDEIGFKTALSLTIRNSG
jgi:hypothetical protein